jgi:CBS domain-containing protein
MRPSTDLIVIVTDANGTSKTLSSEAPHPGDRPRGIQFGSQLGSGWYVGSFNLARPIDAEHTDLHLGDDVRIMLANGDTVYEGWISALPRSMDTEHSLTVNLSGYMAHTADEPFTEIFVDRDLGRWTSAPRGRVISLVAGSPEYTQPEGPTIAPDATTGQAAMILRTTDEWSSPVRPIAEAWYDGGTRGVGTIYYSVENEGSAGAGDATWSVLVRTTATDDFAATLSSTGDMWPLPDSAYMSASGRYAVVSFFNDATPGGAAGLVYSVHVGPLAVYGPHGLPRVGDDPGGVTASDVIRYLVGRYCPHLSTAGVMDTTYPIGHLVFDESTVYDAMLKVNAFHMLDLACWEGKTIHYRQIDLGSWDWELRHDEAGNQIGLQGDSFENLRNGIVVKYTDVVTGSQERLHPDDHAELRDDSIDNPATMHGRRLYGQPFVVPFPTTAANALELGRLKLAEDLQVRAPGSFTVTGRVRDRSGQWQPPSMIRSGQTIRLTSSATLSDRPRLIHEVTYSADGASATISVDSTRTVIEALLDRTTSALSAAGLS